MYRLQAKFLLLLPLLAVYIAAQADELAAEKIKVDSRKNPGNLSYRWVFKAMHELQTYLPAEPRMIDLRLRMLHTEMSGAERDLYMPGHWAAAVVGDTVDVDLPVERGGYFSLPDLPGAREEDATLMFNSQTQKRAIEPAWVVRLQEHDALAYSDFAHALADIATAQSKIPWHSLAMRNQKNMQYDSLKVCFKEALGTILLNGVAIDGPRRGPCAWLSYDPALLAANPHISFSAPLQLALLDSRVNARSDSPR